MSKKIAILVGGGPAPGINGVINSVVRECNRRKLSVVGIQDGFRGLLDQGEAAFLPLVDDYVSRFGDRGGSILGTSKTDPTKSSTSSDSVLRLLESQQVQMLVTIGGEGTITIADQLFPPTSSISVVHVPKTIDNDLPLPGLTSTFGFQTAREVGSNVVRALLEDARTTKRWYIAVTQGRHAGHLALGIGLAAGASVTLIPEEFIGREDLNRPAVLEQVIMTIVGAVLKRRQRGKNYGVAVVAEGLSEILLQDPSFDGRQLRRDPHGNVRYSEIDFSGILSQRTREKLGQLGLDLEVVHHDIGYELRSAAPNAFDREYTLQLGYGAVEFLIRGGSRAMITRRGDQFEALPFENLRDAVTGKISARRVSLHSETYHIAREYMDRLSDIDLGNSKLVESLSGLTNLSAQDFQREFNIVR
jgi:6-phosphofructokinase 1